MSLVIVDTPIPLKKDVDGVVRVGNTRVTLDTLYVFKMSAYQVQMIRRY